MTVPQRRLSRRLLAGGAVLAFAGCARLFVNPPAQYIFRLTPADTFPPDLPHVQAQLLVAVPSASEALDRRRIALTRSAISLDYFADAEWADTMTALVQTVLQNSFENSRAITAITGSSGLRADFVLGTEIRHFEAQYGTGGSPPDIWVSIAAKLAKMPEREIVAQATFERRVTAAANDLPSIVTAFDRALGAVAAEIVAWTVSNAAMSRGNRRL
jgi:cholesterol transport system auxiliary component